MQTKPFYTSRYSSASYGQGIVQEAASEVLAGVATARQGLSTDPETAIATTFSNWNYQIGKQFRLVFREELSRRSVFPLIASSPYTLKLTIDRYGYQAPVRVSLSDTVMPTVYASGVLTSPSGEVLWKSSRFKGPMGLPNYEDRKLSQFLEDPAYARRGWDLALREVTQELINDLLKPSRQ